MAPAEVVTEQVDWSQLRITLSCRRYVRLDGKVLFITLDGIELAQCDGDALYRVDDVGTRAVVLPAICRRGLHRLAAVGYRITEGNGTLRVRCDRCATTGNVDHSWIFRSTGLLANRAELDDTGYNEANRR